MPDSRRYRELGRAVSKLRKALLPRRFSPTGTYRSEESVHLGAVSFRILVHAEIEAFIEDRALELFDEGWKAWSVSRVPTRVILGLLGYSGTSTMLPPGKLGGDAANQKAYDDLATPVQSANNVWRASHRENHGVKEANVLRLLLPLGIESTELDTTLLADLTSYGADRGTVAHRSSVGVGRYADPREEVQRAEQLVASLRALDRVLDVALKEVRTTQAAIVRSRHRRAAAGAHS